MQPLETGRPPMLEEETTQTVVDLPAVYSQGGFVQVRTIVLQMETGPAAEAIVPDASSPAVS
jgi:hypothetical protein